MSPDVLPSSRTRRPKATMSRALIRWGAPSCSHLYLEIRSHAPALQCITGIVNLYDRDPSCVEPGLKPNLGSFRPLTGAVAGGLNFELGSRKKLWARMSSRVAFCRTSKATSK